MYHENIGHAILFLSHSMIESDFSDHPVSVLYGSLKFLLSNGCTDFLPIFCGCPLDEPLMYAYSYYEFLEYLETSSILMLSRKSSSMAFLQKKLSRAEKCLMTSPVS